MKLRAVAAALVALLLVACTSYVLGPADAASLRAATSMQAQDLADLAPDSGVPVAAVRASERAIYCRLSDVLNHSNVPPPDGGIACERSDAP